MTKILSDLHRFVWGAPSLILILGTGIYIAFRTRLVQSRYFPRAFRELIRKLRTPAETDGISPFQALCTALAATVGTGNLVGVAGAICIGGPGSIFWMWICGFLGMGIKYAEVTLALHYRVQKGNEFWGGPMYMITQGLPERFHFLAWIYAFLGFLCAFGVGNTTQISTVISSINAAQRAAGMLPSRQINFCVGVLLAIIIGLTLSGGARRIGKTAERLVPFAALAYLILCCGILLIRADAIISAFRAIFQGAFSPRSVTGGVLGSAFHAMRTGCARGVFTNEAGMGTASIAHSSARNVHPVEQGMLGIIEVFLDTIVLCTMTALVILTSGVSIPYGTDAAATLTDAAFRSVYGSWVSIALSAALCCFAFATVLGWSFYGIRCAQFLFGPSIVKIFPLLQAIAVLWGSTAKADVLWQFAETMNGLMAIPNLIALTALSPTLVRLTKSYDKSSGITHTGGGIPCRFPSTQTAVSPLPCESSIPLLSPQKRKAKRSIT